MNEDDFEDQDDFDPSMWRLVESKPMTVWTFVVIFVNFWVGIFHNLAETAASVSDAVLGHEGYEKHQRDFADTVRLELEALPTEE